MIVLDFFVGGVLQISRIQKMVAVVLYLDPQFTQQQIVLRIPKYMIVVPLHILTHSYGCRGLKRKKLGKVRHHVTSYEEGHDVL